MRERDGEKERERPRVRKKDVKLEIDSDVIFKNCGDNFVFHLPEEKKREQNKQDTKQ